MRMPMRKPGFFPAGGSYFLHCFQRPSGLGVLFREGALPRTSVSDFTGIRDLLLGSDRSFFNDLKKCLAIQAQTCINKVQRSLPLPLPSFWLSPSHVACPLPCVSRSEDLGVSFLSDTTGENTAECSQFKNGGDTSAAENNIIAAKQRLPLRCT